MRELNTALQQLLNPPRPGQPAVERFGWRFQTGDKFTKTIHSLFAIDTPVDTFGIFEEDADLKLESVHDLLRRSHRRILWRH